MKSEDIKKAEIDLYDKNARNLNTFKPWDKCVKKYLKTPYDKYMHLNLFYVQNFL